MIPGDFKTQHEPRPEDNLAGESPGGPRSNSRPESSKSQAAATRHWLLLQELSGQDASQLRCLQSIAADPAEIIEAGEASWLAAGANQAVLSNRRQWSAKGARHALARKAARTEEILCRQGARLIACGSTAYPPLLAEIYDPPPLLYVSGDPDCLLKPQFAVVGSRRCSGIGARAAAEFSAALVSAGFVVCSGLAMGVDAAAHRASLAAGGETVAVMATGIDGRYPRRNAPLADAIAGSGALVTEFAPGAPPRRERFPQRNRVISGMSVGVLVVEAGLRSGSLITARMALEQNREVFAIPHSLYHPGGQGCLKLLGDGAKLTQTLDDLLEEVGALTAVMTKSAATAEPGRLEPPAFARRVWRQLGYEPVSVDQLVTEGAGDVAAVVAALQALEMAGFVEQSGGLFMRRV